MNRRLPDGIRELRRGRPFRSGEPPDAATHAPVAQLDTVARRWEFQWMDGRIGLHPEQYPEYLDMAGDDDREGRFFLERISLFYLVSPQLSLTVYELRQAWIRQYGIKTVPEYMLLDQAMLAYFHVIRTNKEIANLFSLLDDSLYCPDEPLVRIVAEGQKRGWKVDRFNAEDHLRKLQDVLLSVMERFAAVVHCVGIRAACEQERRRRPAGAVERRAAVVVAGVGVRAQVNQVPRPLGQVRPRRDEECLIQVIVRLLA